MMRLPFNTGWTASPSVGFFESIAAGAPVPRTVHLPYDFLRHEERTPDGTSHTAFYPSATVQYVKRFDVTEEQRAQRHVVEFDGVYRDAVVYVNGEHAGQCANGYTRFHVPIDAYLRYGKTNEIKVVARSHADSRWYSGVGIYREVHLLTGPLLHIHHDGVQVSTPDVEDCRAIVSVATTIENSSPTTRTVAVQTKVLDAAGRAVAADLAPVTVLPGESEVLRQRLLVLEPQLWDVDNPHLYEAEIALLDGGIEIDRNKAAFGIRKLQLDPQSGLRINGKRLKLRGACIHHDNGLLGAAAIRRAEERRIELLKSAGFNAIRSAHNPLSTAMLDACDRLGMLVMDETFDMWTTSKTADDYSLRFADWWERDVDALVRKDFNHPSVIMYSIGNEVTEAGTGIGARWGRKIAERIRSLDPSRYITNAVNPVLAVAEELARQERESAAEPATGPLNDNDPNAALGNMDDQMKQLLASEQVAGMTAESFAALDVAGLNYAEARYALDAERFPNRVIVGTEAFPSAIAENWPLISGLSHVIGEFTWTGWDYLGETGLGRVNYEPEVQSSAAPYPWLTAWCGDLDITGHRRPISHYRERVYGLSEQPYIAVHRPQHCGQAKSMSGWTWSDSIASWTWDVEPGTPTTVEVYSVAAEVELVVNGLSYGRRPAGPAHGFLATFDVDWQPGEITAIDYDGQTEVARATLRTAADEVALRASADRTTLVADDGDLAYIDITLEDCSGVVATQLTSEIVVHVSGAGGLEGLGNANPITDERYDGTRTSTFDGRALAIIRPSGPGDITVSITSRNYGSVTLSLHAAECQRS
ncbi:glycoside hydrolase family 2 TIM barrel-domain containing protein [Pseudarthrobacter sp. NPDC058329]|uniref:glycoside hydrolase family 2 TIM barrel-domain containing protein n=1 Tax=Pseudarthrobacter sp. NPDC058329 TaxID=3346448 RepID=UPI0036DA7442